MRASREELIAFALAVSPSGVPYLRAPQEGDAVLDGPRAAPIAKAFERGAGAGVLIEPARRQAVCRGDDAIVLQTDELGPGKVARPGAQSQPQQGDDP